MKMFRLMFAASLGVIGISATARAQWAVTILDPSGTDVGNTSSIAWGTSGGQQVGMLSTNFGDFNACVWAGNAASVVNLRPVLNGVRDSQAVAVENGVQVGFFSYFTGSGYAPRACRWTGSAASMVKLDTAVTTGSSAAYAIDGGRPSGYIQLGSQPGHAAIWAGGTSTSFTELHPVGVAGSGGSQVSAAAGGKQVGFVEIATRRHASLWSGTAASWVDLHPAGSVLSEALGIDGNQQFGYVTPVVDSHPAVWTGTAASVVDLNPPGSTGGRINAAAMGAQVGYIAVGGKAHAGMWRGTVASYVDLHALLSPIFDDSRAYGISKDATHIYVVGFGHIAGDNYQNHALLWTYTTCPADFNGQDGLTIQDIFDFLNAWFAGDVRADFDGVTGLAVQDIFAFLNAWFAGCV